MRFRKHPLHQLLQACGIQRFAVAQCPRRCCCCCCDQRRRRQVHDLPLLALCADMFVNFPGTSLLEWHPFSLTSGPDEVRLSLALTPTDTCAQDTLQINIKALGNFTKVSPLRCRYWRLLRRQSSGRCWAGTHGARPSRPRQQAHVAARRGPVRPAACQLPVRLAAWRRASQRCIGIGWPRRRFPVVFLVAGGIGQCWRMADLGRASVACARRAGITPIISIVRDIFRCGVQVASFAARRTRLQQQCRLLCVWRGVA